MDKLNSLRGGEPTGPQIKWSTQTPASHFKYQTSPPKTSPMVSAIMGRINHYAIDNGDVAVHPSDYPFKSTYKSFPYQDTTPIKPIDDDEMDHILEFFH